MMSTNGPFQFLTGSTIVPGYGCWRATAIIIPCVCSTVFFSAQRAPLAGTTFLVQYVRPTFQTIQPQH